MEYKEKLNLIKYLCAAIPKGLSCIIKGDETKTPRILSGVFYDGPNTTFTFPNNEGNFNPPLEVYTSEIIPVIDKRYHSDYEKELITKEIAIWDGE